MPLTFFSHQAPVLPLKFTWPQLVSGQALVIGSMSPDFEFFLTGKTQWTIGHTLPGQFIFCLPLTLLMVWIVSRIIARPLAAHLPDAGTFHLQDYHVLAYSTRRRGYWLKAVPCALIGSFSHLIWDSFTHRAGWSARHLGYANTTLLTVGSHSLGVCKVLQHGSTLFGGLFTLMLLYRIGKGRLLLQWAGTEPGPTGYKPPTKGLGFWLAPLLFAVLVFGITAYMKKQSPAATELASWSAVALHTFTAAFIGLCLACFPSSFQQRNE